jgi:hypothetical protein
MRKELKTKNRQTPNLPAFFRFAATQTIDHDQPEWLGMAMPGRP